MDQDRSTAPGFDHPWAQKWERVCRALDVSPESGLSPQEVAHREEEFGKNKLEEREQESVWSILFRQFTSMIMAVLFAAVVLSFAFGRWVDGTAIMFAILINAGIGFVTELRAVRTMEALMRMDVTHVRVKRGERSEEVDSRDLVPGDIVTVESGDIAAADMRVIESNGLTVNESALTGESVSATKRPDPVSKDAPLAERDSMLFKGTTITKGSGLAVVVSTGMATEMGAVSTLVQEARSERDPLKQGLDRLASRLVRAIVVVAAVAGAAGVLAGKDLLLMIETAVALFVAAVPEGLPIVSTVALAYGMKRMAERNALVRRLSAVQTLGSTTVVFTDKTGTLTENRMSVREYRFDRHRVEVTGDQEGHETRFADPVRSEEIDVSDTGTLKSMLLTGVLCNNASVEQEQPVGEPMEIALLAAGEKVAMKRSELLEKMPELREVSFDPELKMMATFHRDDQGVLEAVKGAPSEVLRVSSSVAAEEGTRELDQEQRDYWQEQTRELASRGMRVLGLATRRPDSENVEPYEGLIFLGLVGMVDPVRESVKKPIETCREAGVRVIMVTGDQKETAVAVGEQLGMLEGGPPVFHGNDLTASEKLDEERRAELRKGAIFARVGPKQKLDLISLHQSSGGVVAMTGDGVNDAPALKKADIGVAMGKRGEPVAKDAADIVLQDDQFPTIIMAIEQGRAIFNNIRNFVVYMVSGNIGEILIVFLASVVGAPLPLFPLQILYINIVNDIFPAIALAVSQGSGTEMHRPPRDPSERIMTPAHWRATSIFGLLIALPVLSVFAYAVAVEEVVHERAATMTFLSIAFARLLHVLNMRGKDESLVSNHVTRNPYVWGALGLCTALLLFAVYVPPVAHVLSVVRLSAFEWLLVGAASITALLLGQLSLRVGIVGRKATG